jgi:uncharacterized protein (DUF305 family)
MKLNLSRVSHRTAVSIMPELSDDVSVDYMHGITLHHHWGADMSLILLNHSKDREIREPAEEIIHAQKREISFMYEWLITREH